MKFLLHRVDYTLSAVTTRQMTLPCAVPTRPPENTLRARTKFVHFGDSSATMLRQLRPKWRDVPGDRPAWRDWRPPRGDFFPMIRHQPRQGYLPATSGVIASTSQRSLTLGMVSQASAIPRTTTRPNNLRKWIPLGGLPDPPSKLQTHYCSVDPISHYTSRSYVKSTKGYA
jgi:hypothetical protein